MKDIHKSFTEKFEVLLPKYILHESVLMLILLIITNNKKNDIKDYRKLSLINLINLSSLEANEESENYGKYDSGIFSQLIINIVKLSQACLINFFIGYNLLSSALSSYEIDDLFYNKKEVGGIKYSELNEFYSKKLKEINKDTSETAVDGLCLPYVFEPIKNCKLLFITNKISNSVCSR